MKQLLHAVCVFNFFTLMSMGRVVSSTQAGLARRPHFQQCRNFGKTHFIAGYKYHFPELVQLQPKESFVHSVVRSGNTVELIDTSRVIQPFFTTAHDVCSIILNFLDNARSRIHIAAFSLTDVRIAEKLIAAHKNGLDVCIIMDAGNMKQAYSKAQKLIDNGLSVWRYDHSLRKDNKKFPIEALMHHKCLIVDDVVIVGSANYTRSAYKRNIENINIVRDAQTVEEYLQEIQRLKNYCVNCTQQ